MEAAAAGKQIKHTWAKTMGKAVGLAVDNRVVGSYCTSKLFQEMFHGRKTNLFKKSPRLFGFQRSQIESQLNGADG